MLLWGDLSKCTTIRIFSFFSPDRPFFPPERAQLHRHEAAICSKVSLYALQLPHFAFIRCLQKLHFRTNSIETILSLLFHMYFSSSTFKDPERASPERQWARGQWSGWQWQNLWRLLLWTLSVREALKMKTTSAKPTTWTRVSEAFQCLPSIKLKQY